MTTTRTRRPHHPFAHLKTDKRDLISWVQQDGKEQTKAVSPNIRDAALFNNKLVRQSPHYKTRLHYEGFYWFAGTGNHVFHDSMEEFYALMWLDHQQTVRKIAAQPLHILFADGSHHYPDYLTEHRNGDRTLYDVRPEARITDDAAATFSRTAELCAHIGWRYQLITGDLTLVQRHNLEVISGYRNQWYRPPDITRAAVQDFLTAPHTLRDLLSFLGPKRPGAYIHIAYHLIWNRTIQFDTKRPLTFDTPLRSTAS